MVAVSFVIAPRSFAVDGHLLADDHAVISLDIAMVRAFCGRASFFSHAGRIGLDLKADMSRRHIPLRQLVVDRAGSVTEYCAKAEWPRVNNENSLMLVETALLRASPDLSLSELGQRLHVIRILLLAGFVFVLLHLGASWSLSLGAMLTGLIVLGAMPGFIYSVYPFLFTLILALAAAYGWVLLHPPSTLPGWLTIAAAIGAVSAFTVNMRTSYLPVAAMFFLTFAVAVWWRQRDSTASSQHWRRTVIIGSGFLAGYVAFESGLITRYLRAEERGGATHSVMHPLVLALGVPETAFSRELGIHWEDAVGTATARKIDPDTDYLGARYNAALWQFYTGLWRTRTGEMVQLYRTKFSIAGREMLTVLRGSPGPAGTTIAVLLAPLDWMAQIVWLAVLYLAIAVGMLVQFLRHKTVGHFLLGLLALAACLLQVESGIVYSLFVQQYHNYSGFFAVFVSLAGLQLAVNFAWSRCGGMSEGV